MLLSNLFYRDPLFGVWSGGTGVHCPRAGPGRVEAFFAGPDPGPQGRATYSLALALGQEGRVRANPGPLIFSSELNFFSQIQLF